jgi:integrase
LHQLARARTAHLPPGQTLQATALVHEAYLRLTDKSDVAWESRQHFFFAAARAMRDILIEQARRKAGTARGGGRQRQELDDACAVLEPPADNVLADVVHGRGAFTTEEIERIAAAARGGPAYRGLSGAQRSLLYVLASATGLRAKECAAVRKGDFDPELAHVHVAGMFTKNGKDAVQPIPSFLRPTERRAGQLAAAVGDHLVHIHVELCAAAGHPDVQWKHVLMLAGEDLIADLDDPLVRGVPQPPPA